MRTEKREIGDLGERIALTYLIKHGFVLVERNYLKPWGEIDIIARKGEKIHFVEVKTQKTDIGESVTHETDRYRAEENVHSKKIVRIRKTMQTYLLEKGIEDEWVFDVAIVSLDTGQRRAKVTFLEDIVL